MGAKYVFNPLTGNLDTTDVVAFNGEVNLGTAAAPSVFFTGDTNTGLYSPGTDQVALSTNGTGRLFVDANGNVGIGAPPTAQFVVAGSVPIVRLTDVGGNAYHQFEGAGNGTLRISADEGNTGANTSSILFNVDGSEKFRITSAGNVGIGTSSPASLLHLQGSAAQNLTITRTSNISSAGDPYGYIDFIGENSLGSGPPDYSARIVAAHDSSLGATTRGSTLSFYTQFSSANASEKMRIDSSGRVGIGTTSPNKTLTVAGDILGSSLASNGNLVLNCDDNANNASNDAIIFQERGNEKMRMDGSGRLLVGTSSAVGTSSGTGLIVRSPVNNNHAGEILLQNAYTRPGDGSAVGSIKFQDSEGSTYAQITGRQDGTASSSSDVPGRLVFSTTADGASSPTERMRITQDGSVFIGNTGTMFGNTGAQISASGTGIFSRDSLYPLLINRQTTDGTIVEIRRGWQTVGTISVTTTATAYNTSSDYRLKENVTPVTDGITRLQQLKPSRFNFIADPGKTVDGFLAHEVQSIVPEAITGEKDAVDEDGNPVYQGIDQSKLVPLLTAALQEAVAKIESLEARLTAAGI